jgi:CheY-like chemotaxis protein
MSESKVLVVDDDRDWWEIVSRMLKERDCELNWAGSANQATEFLNDHKDVDVVILNMALPRGPYLDGLDVLQGVCDLETHTQCIILTANWDLETSNVVLNEYNEIVSGLEHKTPALRKKNFLQKFDKALERANRRKQRGDGDMPRIKLAWEDQRRLAEELNRLPQWANGRTNDRKAVLLTIGLPRAYVNSYPFSDIATTDTEMVLANLKELGALSDRPQFYALGALAEYLWQNAIGTDGRVFLAYLILRYELIQDLAVRAQLMQSCPPIPTLPVLNELSDLHWDRDALEMPWRGATDHNALRQGLEQNWSNRAAYLNASFLEKGAHTARSVCVIELADGWAAGTGFAIAPNLVLTNYHVWPTPAQINGARARFGFRFDCDGQLLPGQEFQIKRLVAHSPETVFDYALVEVDGNPGDDSAIGYLRLSPKIGIRTGKSAFIIQHPMGRPQQIVLQDNWITYVAADGCRMQYLTNTDSGSSGAPVCDENWNVIALHHSKAPLPPSPLTANIRGNEGIPITAFYDQIAQYLPY